nr:NAC domain-containing protein [Tanacetum cinerariifolium]
MSDSEALNEQLAKLSRALKQLERQILSGQYNCSCCGGPRNGGNYPRVLVTIKILVLRNLYSIVQASHNSLTVVRFVEVPHYSSDCQTRNQLVNEPNPGNNYDFSCFDQPPRYHIDQSPPQDLDSHSHFMLLATENNFIWEEILRTQMPNPLVVPKEPEGSDNYTEVINTILERENDEFIKSSVDNLVLIPKESELALNSTDLECSMPFDPPLPCIDVLGDTIVDIDLPFGEHLDTFSTGDMEIDFNPRDIETNDLILVPRIFDAPLGNSDSISRSYDVTFSNILFDFNDDYTLCYDNSLFDEEFEDISSLDPPESTPVINESSLLVTPLLDPK